MEVSISRREGVTVVNIAGSVDTFTSEHLGKTFAKLIGEGKSEDDVVNSKPIQDLEKQAGANEMATANFLRLIYRSLKA